MTNEQKSQLSNLTKYPEFQLFKQVVQERLLEFQLKPLDRNGNIEAQALAKEDAKAFLDDLLSTCGVLERTSDQKVKTYE